MLVFGGAIVGGAIVTAWLSIRLARQTSERAATEAGRLREAFAALSQDALRQNRTDFLHNADAVLQPVRDTLDKVQARLTDVDKAREGSYRAVTAQLGQLATAQRELRDAAEGLTRSLKSPNVRGRWGELQLRRIVELAGMTSQCDFVEKPTASTEDGARQTPDLIVTLPGGATIVVDAKVPIEAYLAASEARTDGERKDRMAAHARQVRDHIRTLGGKEYWRQFPASPEFVVMFLPLEPLLAAALEEDSTLLDQAASLRVIPATPLTLLALLKAAALGWRQEQIAHNAEEIQQIGRELYERLGTMVEHLESVGRNIKQAGDSYDRLVGSLEQKVLPGARRFKDLGVQSTKELEVAEPLRLAVRPVTRVELTGRDAADETPNDQAADAEPPAAEPIRPIDIKSRR